MVHPYDWHQKRVLQILKNEEEEGHDVETELEKCSQFDPEFDSINFKEELGTK